MAYSDKVKCLAYYIDPECWESYSGKPKAFKQAMDKRRLKALTDAEKRIEEGESIGADIAWIGQRKIEFAELGRTLGDILVLALMHESIPPETTGDTDMNENTGEYVVGVCFKHDLRPELGWRHNSRKVYHYLTDIPGLQSGDTVIVDSPTTGPTCVVVTEIMRTHSLASKWVISKVDFTHHKQRLERQKRIKELKADLDKRLAVHRSRAQFAEALRDYWLKEGKPVLASHEPAPTKASEPDGEVVAYEAWSDSKDEWILTRESDPRRDQRALVRQSALTACQQEVERLRVEKRDAYHNGYTSRDGVVNACRKRAETAEDRNAELEKAISDHLPHAQVAFLWTGGRKQSVEEVSEYRKTYHALIAALKGQSNEA